MRGTTIAIVDDDAGVRTALRELLRSMGFDAVAFDSAEEFLAECAHARFACLIADVHLPGMSGARLAHALAATGSNLPVLLITAHDDSHTLELVRQAPAVGCLRKPFGEDELADAIWRALAA